MNLSPPLLRWYDQHGRDLPWRKTRDPYKILVSEIMLQQTQVTRVLLFYKKWLKKFPNWKSLAGAKNADVIHAWAGLGYNRRALQLKEIAKTIVDHGTPSTECQWQNLKGIGPYTAAALAVFSSHKRTLPIDTNVRRVLDRLLLGLPFPNPKQDDHIRKLALRTVFDVPRFHDLPQALFDLATLICTKKPTCAICPVRKTCLAAPKFLSGKIKIPKRMIKKAPENKHRDKPYPDRIYRGRILKLVRESPQGISLKFIGPKIDPRFSLKHDQTWLERMIIRLIRDGFLKIEGNLVILTNS